MLKQRKPLTRSACALVTVSLCAHAGGPEDGSAASAGSQRVDRSEIEHRVQGDPPSVGRKFDLQSMSRSALADAARRTGRAVTELKVLSAEAVVWPDGSLGCGQPGAMYTMAPVRGYRIRIEAGAAVLNYHASERGQLVFCPAAGSSLAPPPESSR